MTDMPIRPAATVIVLRDFPDHTQILMGQRGSKAAFMPNKFVFPGGAVDAADHDVALAEHPDAHMVAQLDADPRNVTGSALITAAIRELWEETGLILGASRPWSSPPDDWVDYAATGHCPCAHGMHYFFRAITPPGRTRRFDARFFIVDATQIQNDLDDFSKASDELSHLQWVSLEDARTLNLPFITRVVLGEVAALTHIEPLDSVPFFDNQDEASFFKRLQGTPQ